MLNTSVKHIFFDLDHTLWDFEHNSAQTFSHIFKTANVTVDLSRFLDTYKPINLRYWKLYREEKITKPLLRYKRLKDTFNTLNYSISDDLINHLAEIYIDNLANYNQLFTDAVSILDYLKPKYALHIITNGFEEIQVKKMKNSGILHYFTCITTSECVGVKKPNPKIFNHALAMAKAKPENSLMVGDSLEADIYGAEKVGMQTIHFNCHNEEVSSGQISINHLKELKQYL
ncbi:MAG: noncanonical pyrimidine nucleotidase, YjjG family [Flavobacteriales bacterium]|nr:MAG: noncanonical pyrimidine nucleotidase, YjjG family [Flavobacteriales bacterium]